MKQKMHKQFNSRWIVGAILLLLPIVLVISRKLNVKIYTDQKGIIIQGIYGMTIPFSNLEQVETISKLPIISMKTHGYSFGNKMFGNFRLSDNSDVKLFVKSGYPPYILIHSKDTPPIYINFEDKFKTITMYNNLIKSKVDIRFK